MRLELLWSDVAAVTAGAATCLAGGVLAIDLEALQGLLEADPRLERVRIDLATPGESCRIGRVFDVFAPRAKDDGDEDFPGVLGPLARAGSGRTRALGHVAVVVTDQQLDNPATLAVIDMSGPVAQLTAFRPRRGPWRSAPKRNGASTVRARPRSAVPSYTDAT